MMKVSIIIPVYNTGERLRRCLDSVLAQTFKDFECLVIDDGSTDSSFSIIKEYVLLDNRVKVFHKENGGVSSARNFGLDAAKGEWIVFLDSDDVLKKHHLEMMVSKMTSEIDFGYTSWEAIMRDHSMKYKISEDKCYLGKEKLKDFICNTEILDNMMPWGKIFRRSIIEKKHLRFDTHLTISEDRLFCYSYLLGINGAITLSDISYTHDASDIQSLSNRTYPLDVYEYRYKAFVKPTIQLIEDFEMSPNESLRLWKYLWFLFTTVIYAIGSSGNNVWAISRIQKHFYSDNFCESLYDSLKSSAKIQTLMERPENRQIIQQKFLVLNLKIRIRFLLQKIHI